jgi:hypothetical protein
LEKLEKNQEILKNKKQEKIEEKSIWQDLIF